MRFAIWYHLYNLKNVKNTHGGVLILVKLQAITYLIIYNSVFRNKNLFRVLVEKPDTTIQHLSLVATVLVIVVAITATFLRFRVTQKALKLSFFYFFSSFVDHVVLRQTKIIISPLPQRLWLPTWQDVNLLWWAPTHNVTRTFIMWSCKITGQTRIIISPLLQCLWPTNLQITD